MKHDEPTPNGPGCWLQRLVRRLVGRLVQFFVYLVGLHREVSERLGIPSLFLWPIFKARNLSLQFRIFLLKLRYSVVFLRKEFRVRRLERHKLILERYMFFVKVGHSHNLIDPLPPNILSQPQD